MIMLITILAVLGTVGICTCIFDNTDELVIAETEESLGKFKTTKNITKFAPGDLLYHRLDPDSIFEVIENTKTGDVNKIHVKCIKLTKSVIGWKEGDTYPYSMPSEFKLRK